MIQNETHLPIYSPAKRSLLYAAPVILFSVLIGYLAYSNLMLPALILMGIFIAAVSIFRPEMVTMTVFFLLYTNALTIAVNFHNVPLIIGALFPALLLIPIIHYVVLKRKKPVIRPALLIIVLYLLVQTVGGIFASYPTVSWDKIATFIFEGIGLYILTTNTVRTPQVLRLSMWAIVIAGLLMGGLTLYQEVTQTYNNNYGGFAQVGTSFTAGPGDLSGGTTKMRLTGPIGEDNRFAQIMAVTAPLALFLAFGERSLKLKILGLAATFLIIVGGLLTYSRGGLIALGGTALLTVALRFIKFRYLAVLALIALLVPTTVPYFTGRLDKLQGVTLSGLINNQAEGGITSADASVQSRVTEMISALLMFADHPLVGVGPGNYAYHYQDYAPKVGLEVRLTNRQPHTLYGGIAAENGILGVACILGIVWITLRDLFMARRAWMKIDPLQVSIATGLILAIFAYLISGIFLHFAFIRYFWLVIGLAGAAGSIYRTEAPERHEERA